MPLVIHQITGMPVGGAAKKVIHPNVIKRRAGGKTTDVTAEAIFIVVSPHDHGHGVPAHQ